MNSVQSNRADGLSDGFQSLLDGYAHRALYFLEYGVGTTTTLISRFIKRRKTQKEELFLAMEEDPQRLNAVCERLNPSPFEYFFVKSLRDQSALNPILSGASFPQLFDKQFHFIVVDCQHYSACVRPAAELLSPTGTLVLRGSSVQEFPHIVDLFSECRRTGQFLVLTGPRRFERPHRAQSSAEARAIVVPLQGELASAQWNTSCPWIRAYAERTGAQLCEIHVPPDVSPVFLKFYAARQSGAYDRILLIDSDIIVRPHAPNLFELVPQNELGAMFEGRIFEREEWIQKNTDFYGTHGSGDVPYFNSGVLLANPRILRQLFEIDHDVLAFPKYEQNHLNWRVARHRIPLFELPIEFNYIAGNEFSDWRRSLFFHFAGYGKARHRHYNLLQMQGQFDKATAWKQTPLQLHNYKYIAMRTTDHQMRGRTVISIDSDDMLYANDCGIAGLDDGHAYALIRNGAGIGARGRYSGLDTGRYLVRIITTPLAIAVGSGELFVEVSITHDQVECTQQTKTSFRSSGIAILPELEIRGKRDCVEVRFYRHDSINLFIMCIEIERIDD
ncbi:MAG: glycosyltransferase [Terracidiphilus sp.]|jgi:hypothetical protein